MFEEKKTNLFPKSLTGTIMQEGSTRERRVTYNVMLNSNLRS